MSSPKVRLHPDGRAVVELVAPDGDARWIAVGGGDAWMLHVEMLDADAVADWPEYGDPA